VEQVSICGERCMTLTTYSLFSTQVLKFIDEFNSIHRESKSTVSLFLFSILLGSDGNVFVTIVDASGLSVYQSWSKLTCPLSEGVLKGLYHFPLVTGNVLLMLEAPFQALIQSCNVVGSTGQVHAIINPAIVSDVELGFLKRWYRNIWFAETNGQPYDPHADRMDLFRRRALLIHGTKDAKSFLHVFESHDSILKTICTYMGTFPSKTVTTVVNRLPPPLALNPLNATLFAREYVEYFKTYVGPVFSFLSSNQSSFWMMGCYQLDESFTADQCCESLLRLQSASCGYDTGVKPKEQLMIGSTMALISRFKKSWATTNQHHPPPPIQTSLDESDTIRSTLASLFAVEENTSSVASVHPPSGIPIPAGTAGMQDDEATHIREAAMNVVWSHSNRSLDGPFADTLRSLAEELLLQTNASAATVAPPNHPNAPLLSTLLQTPPGDGQSTVWSTQPSPVPQLPRFLLEDILS
jgi:hypothetical protein